MSCVAMYHPIFFLIWQLSSISYSSAFWEENHIHKLEKIDNVWTESNVLILMSYTPWMLSDKKEQSYPEVQQ